MTDIPHSPYFFTLMLVLLLTVVLRILSGGRLSGRFLLGLSLQAAVAMGWLGLSSVSPGQGSVILSSLAGISLVGPTAKFQAAVATACFGFLIWWSDEAGGDIPLFMDWFNVSVTLMGAAVLRAFLEDAAENRWMVFESWLGAAITIVAVVASWVPAWSTAAAPLLLTAYIGLGAALVKTARKRE